MFAAQSVRRMVRFGETRKLNTCIPCRTVSSARRILCSVGMLHRRPRRATRNDSKAAAYFGALLVHRKYTPAKNLETNTARCDLELHSQRASQSASIKAHTATA